MTWTRDYRGSHPVCGPKIGHTVVWWARHDVDVIVTLSPALASLFSHYFFLSLTPFLPFYTLFLSSFIWNSRFLVLSVVEAVWLSTRTTCHKSQYICRPQMHDSQLPIFHAVTTTTDMFLVVSFTARACLCFQILYTTGLSLQIQESVCYCDG
jgi:hypothetical protein